MKSKSRHFIILVFAIAGIIYSAAAQDTVVNVYYRGRLDSLQSSILNQERHIQVFLPPGYKPGSISTKPQITHLLT